MIFHPFFLRSEAIYPIFALGVFLLPTEPLTIRERIKYLADAGIIVAGSIFVFWVYIIAPIIASNEAVDLSLAVSVAYPIMDLIILAALAELIFGKLSFAERKPPLFLAFGLIIILASDTIFSIQTRAGTYVSSDLPDTLWLIGYMLFWLAGVEQANSKPISHRAPLSASSNKISSYTHFLSYLWIGTTAILLVLSYENKYPINFPTFIVFSIAMVVLASIRQKVVLDEINGLLATTLSQIDRLKRAEKALQESENKYKAIFENTGTAMTIVEDNNIISLANSEFEKLSGYSRDEIEGKISWTDFAVKEDIDWMLPQHILRRIDPSALPKSYEFRIKDRQGNIKNILLQIDIIPGTKKSIGSLIDITERKRMEEALHESTEKYKILSESSQDMIYVISRDDRIEYVNGTAARGMGLPAEKIIGRLRSRLFPPEINERQKPNLSRVLEMGLSVHSVNLMIVGGKEIWQDTILIPLKTNDNETYAVLGISRDITQHKRAEEELKKTQSRLRLAMDLAKLVHWEYDIKTDLFTFDDQFYALYGTTAEREGGLMMSSQDYARKFIPVEDHSLVAEEIGKALATTDPNFAGYVEHRVIRGDGTEGFIAVRYRVVKDEAGRTIKTYGANQDITERMRAEDALRKSETRYRTLFEAGKDAIFLFPIRPDGLPLNFADVNPVACQIYGYTRDELLNMSAYDLTAPEYHEMMAVLGPKLIETGKIRAEWEDICKDGHRIHVDVSVTSFKLGGQPICMAVVRDITERKRAENKLKWNTALLEAQVEASPDGILVVDEKGQCIITNQRFLDMWSVPEEVRDTKDDATFLDNVAEKIRNPDQFMKKVLYLYEHQNEISRDTIELKDGSVFDRYSSPVLGRDYSYYGRIWTFRDVTEQKRAENRILASLKEKEVLLKEVHHRVKNNLGVISALLSLQSSYITDEDIIKIFRDSQNRIRSMALVHENLYRSKDLNKVDLNEYINKLVSQLSQSYGDLADKICFKVNSENINLNINTAIPCGMIINELVSNSLKHAFPVGRSGEVCIDLASEDEGFRLVVSDNGIGIKDDMNIKESKTLGFRLIDTLVKQIDGEMSLDTINGFRCEIHFKGLK